MVDPIYDIGRLGPAWGRTLALPRNSWIDRAYPVDADRQRLARPDPAGGRGQRHGEAEALGQGVQPQPPEVRPPQRAAEGPGGAVHRGEATAEQAPHGAVRWLGGEAPPAGRSAATPGRPARSAGRARRDRGLGVQPSGAAQADRARSDRAAQPLPGVAALCAAGPRGRRSRLLEAVGREVAVERADAASSRVSAGAAALAAGAKRRPARCRMHGESTRASAEVIEIASVTALVHPGQRTDAAVFEEDQR
jgi:hypothetical protein